MGTTRLDIVGIIPARMAASRFPGKPLAQILGRPMIEHVYQRTARCSALDAVYVATCDREIVKAVERFGGRTIMTSTTHQRASDRVAEAVQNIEADIVVMVQGDEPMIRPEMIELAIGPMLDDPEVVCVNLVKRIETLAEFQDRNTIKVVMDSSQNALYFSREPIPTTALSEFAGRAAFKQVCVIPFRREFLFTYTKLPPTPLEEAESVDMLRCLEHGYQVRLVESEEVTQAVDKLDDLHMVEKLMKKDPLLKAYLT
jgi:3-deoxy-manno-octulosonate cytidylyltransferase (CMP-KDO synthetase)